MNEFPEGIGKFEISASSVKSDPNPSSIKSETQRNISSDPNSMSLPSRLCECRCKVVIVQDLLECGVVQLEGANRRKAYCLFFKKDILGRNEVDQKLSTQVPVGTKLLANARLIREKSLIPFLATSVWEDGAIRDENELSKIFFSLEEIEQYNVRSWNLEWFLPRDDCFSNDVDECVTGARRESSVTNAQIKQEFSDEKRIKNQRKNAEGTESFQHSRTRSRSPRNTKSKNPRYLHCQEQDTQESSLIKYKRKHNFREFSDEKKLNNEIGNIERIKTEAVEIDYQQELKKCENQAEESLKLKRENKESAKLNNEIGNIERIKTEAVEIDYQQELKKCENQAEELLKLKREDKEITFGCSSNTKETRETISVRYSCSKGSSPTEEDRNEDEIYRGEKSKAMKDIAIKVLNKTTEDVHKPPKQPQFIPDRRNIVNGKGKILKILDSNYGIAIVLGYGRLCKVLFDIYDVLIEGQVCADLGKTLHEVMQEGDLVCLHAICIENPPISSTDQRIEYMATEVVRASSVEALLNTKLPSEGTPTSLEEVSPDKIKNFHQVAKVVLATQDEEVMTKFMEKDEIPVNIGILCFLKRREKEGNYVNFFCFHCKHLHYRNKNKPNKFWKKHNKHVLTCQGLKCLERGEASFQRMKELKTKQASNESGGFNKPQSMATENEEVLQANEFKRLKTSGNAGKNDSNKLHCFHCQYEGESMSHFTSKKHQDHVKDCGTKILDCPENPQISSAVNRLIDKREMLYLPKENMFVSLYHRYFCLHCKEQFSDKRHLQGVKHTLHMGRNSCTPTCKFVLLDDGKYVSGPGKGAKRCFVCDVNLEWKNNYQAHVKGSIHSRNIFNLLKKKEHAD